ncbi:MAG: hypothetical protein ACHREM_02900 [Polyangiales bacterium]
MSAVSLLFAKQPVDGACATVSMPVSTKLYRCTRDECDVLVIHEGATDEASLVAMLGGPLTTTMFARCHAVGALPVASTLLASRGLLVGITDCGDATRLEEFHEFYDRVHAREVLDTGLYWRCRRLERDGAEATISRFFALYDTEGAEPETYRQLRTRPMTTDWPACFVVRSVATYRAV